MVDCWPIVNCEKMALNNWLQVTIFGKNLRLSLFWQSCILKFVFLQSFKFRLYSEFKSLCSAPKFGIFWIFSKWFLAVKFWRDFGVGNVGLGLEMGLKVYFTEISRIFQVFLHSGIVSANPIKFFHFCQNHRNLTNHHQTFSKRFHISSC